MRDARTDSLVERPNELDLGMLGDEAAEPSAAAKRAGHEAGGVGDVGHFLAVGVEEVRDGDQLAPPRSEALGGHLPPLSFFLALALMRAAVEAEMLPARSERVAPPMARRACSLSDTGKLFPGPANEDFGIFFRLAAVSFAMMHLQIAGERAQ